MTTPDSITLDYRGCPIRVAVEDCQPWFVAVDVCRTLTPHTGGRWRNVTKVCQRLGDDQKALQPLQTRGGVQRVLLVTASGLNKLLGRSEEAAAVEFRNWLTRSALPTIRRAYGAGLREPVAT